MDRWNDGGDYPSASTFSARLAAFFAGVFFFGADFLALAFPFPVAVSSSAGRDLAVLALRLLLVLPPPLAALSASSEMASSSYGHIAIPEPRQALVHVHPGAEELGRLYRPTLAINATPTAFAAALEGVQQPNTIPWAGEAEKANAAYRGWIAPVENPGPVQLSRIIAWLRERLPDDAIVTNGAGNYAGWVHRFFRYRRFGTQLAPTSGTMGYGLPAAVAAKLRHPERMVVCFAGDGCFQMNCQEFATAVQEKAPLVVVLVNNGIHGTIRMHQERDYPGRHIATDLVDPDFAAFARACGGHGETVATNEEFAPAFERAVASGRPAIIDLAFSPEAITPTRTMSQVRGSGRR